MLAGRHPHTIRAWCRSGRLGCLRVGTGASAPYLIDEEELMKVVAGAPIPRDADSVQRSDGEWRRVPSPRTHLPLWRQGKRVVTGSALNRSESVEVKR